MLPLTKHLQRQISALTAALTLATGCAHDTPNLHYLGDADLRYYKEQATEVDFPAVAQPTAEEVAFSTEPNTLRLDEHREIREISLPEAVHTALANNEIIRSGSQFLSPGNSILANPTNTPSVFDPAIQDSGVLFGGRGVEAALSAFDAQLNASMVWGRNEAVQNNAFFGGGATPGGTLVQETGAFNASLQKQFANGGLLSLNHNVNYLGTNLGVAQLFPSVYTGNVALQYQHPLLAGAGTEFTRIAGPIAQSFGGISGVSQGVLIARINNDISIADFQANVRNLVRDVEEAYWDLYLAYRNFDTAVIARNSSLGAWRTAETRWREGDRHRGEEAQARDQYFAAEALARTSRSNIYSAETRLRRLIGIEINDGTVLRPADEPVTAEVVPDWYVNLIEALTNRVELRKQKWNIKSLELQLYAAESLTRPRLDLIANYQVNGFGDDLLSQEDQDQAGTAQGLNSFYETITQGDQTGWNLGVQMNLPIGFRSAKAQVRNYELRLAKARKVLEVQEQEIGHELAAAFQELTRAYAALESNYHRNIAANENVEVLERRYEGGLDDVDTVLRAYERRAQAEVAYFQSLIDYNKALIDLEFRKGTLLAHNNVHLMEGGWTPEAYDEAWERARARSHAFDAGAVLDTLPPEFATDGPFGSVELATPEAANALHGSAPGSAPPIPPMVDDLPAAPGLEAAPPAEPTPTPADTPAGDGNDAL
ncbi:Outer membrane efflux protein [Maioricimonas rarisocia]|uniref:Outer membrane efflux protein n=1 Tax=Maioricimonas rarisocia TaxID=2528026 RepID=A0A517ZFW7_9PLAN|nr:TolC family protein [Maioricimonas rarisocia]QDU41354.1 Outer membrane efflux protein [Maioricimonas rarisocia]